MGCGVEGLAAAGLTLSTSFAPAMNGTPRQARASRMPPLPG
jgi:hypothetical protein